MPLEYQRRVCENGIGKFSNCMWDKTTGKITIRRSWAIRVINPYFT